MELQLQCLNSSRVLRLRTGWLCYGETSAGTGGETQKGWNPQFRQTPAPVNKDKQNSWQVYPNPATDVLTVSNSTGGGAVIAYTIMDVAGRPLLNGGMASGTMNIDVSHLPPGTYLLKLYSGNEDKGHAVFVKN